MKKVLIIFLAAFFVLGCRDTKEGADVEMDKVEVIDDQASIESVDPIGVYVGTLPCPDCPGIETELALNKEGDYVLLTKRLGSDNAVIEQLGKYRVSDVGNLVVLDGVKDGSNTYYLQDGMLLQLDRDGNKIATDLEGDFVLRKTDL